MEPYAGGVEALGPGPSMPEITEQNLIESQGRVRYQLVSRYEQLWAVVEARLEFEKTLQAPVDVRFLEMGRGVLRDMAGLYRLGRPPALAEQEEDANAAVNRAELVEETLRELEGRLRSADQGKQERSPDGAA